MSLLQSIIFGIIEGLTEFLPVSSTGHMILASAWMQMHDDEFVKTFEIAIQLGAILSVLVLYYKRFLAGIGIYLKLSVAFLPTGVIGLLAYKTIKAYLFNPVVVSIALIAGGVALIALDKWSAGKKSTYSDTNAISYGNAFKIGLIQCLSMIPGVSRSAATIFGGMFAGFDRGQAAEFSFLLAIPTMFAATGYDLLKSKASIDENGLLLMFTGGFVSFVVALLAIKFFIAFVTRYGFRHFGYYRIIIGIIFLTLFLTTDLTLND